MEADLVVTKDLLDDIVASAEDSLEDLVAAEPPNIAKKRSVLPPRIERHSEDVVLRMRMMLTMSEFSFFSVHGVFNKTTFRSSLKLLGYIKVDSLSI